MQFDVDYNFCHYNMFNHHFFNGVSSKLRYEHFLKDSCGNDKKLAILVDPPFGGLLQVLAHTIKSITDEWNCLNSSCVQCDLLETFLFFPYFHEKMLKEFFPSFNMADYQVRNSFVLFFGINFFLFYRKL